MIVTTPAASNDASLAPIAGGLEPDAEAVGRDRDTDQQPEVVNPESGIEVQARREQEDPPVPVREEVVDRDEGREERQESKRVEQHDVRPDLITMLMRPSSVLEQL